METIQKTSDHVYPPLHQLALPEAMTVQMSGLLVLLSPPDAGEVEGRVVTHI